MNTDPWAWVLKVWKLGADAPTWLVVRCEAEIPEVSYWVVPWGATHAKAGVEAEPDDGRWLDGPFGTTKVICYNP